MSELDRAVAAFVGDDASETADVWPGAPSAFAREVFTRLVRILTCVRAASEASTPDGRTALAAERLAARVRARAQKRRRSSAKRRRKQTKEITA